jgi:medium-chain acyl-[acyl-carrier-protein] hydrolase
MIDLRAHHPWIDCPGPFPAARPRVRLFCFPPAGVGATLFRAWQSEVLDGIQVCGVQLPGRGDRFAEPPFTQLEPLVDAIASHIRPLLDLPVAFFGHCMGALVAFELARRLRDDGQEPIHLIVSALPSPRLLAQTPPLHRLPAEEFIAALVDLNGVPDDVLANRKLVDLMLPTLRADFEMCETYAYRPGRPLGCRISAYCGRRDPRCPANLVAAWQAETSGRFTSRFFQGDHFFIDSARRAVSSAVSIDLFGTLYAERTSASA